jgi:hypothetical protein
LKILQDVLNRHPSIERSHVPGLLNGEGHAIDNAEQSEIESGCIQDIIVVYTHFKGSQLS